MSRARLLRAAAAAALAAALAFQIGPGAQESSAANQSARLSAQLTPEHLGRSTTIGVSFAIEDRVDRVPPPLQTVEIRYPANFGIALSGLGVESCTAQTLETLGPPGCPPNSLMGHGTAFGEIPFGPTIVHETAAVTIVRAEDQNGRIALLFDAQGISPVDANLVFGGIVLPTRPPYGGDIRISVPLVPSLPEAPDVAVVALQATIGPVGLTYYERVHGTSVPYSPRGIVLPGRCPRAGFPFATAIAFVGGSRASAYTHVRCPARSAHRGRSRARSRG